MMNIEIIERVNKIDECYITHSSIKKAIEGIQRCILMSKSSKEPVNFLLTGDGGTGKTTACNAVLSKYKNSFENRGDREVTVVPAFYSSVPNPVTIKGVAFSMLKSIGAPAPNRGTAIDLTYRLGRLLKECETQVIILDEFHHLLKKDLGKSNDVKEWLKSMINEYKVPVVLVGTPECSDIIDSDTQLARRFKYRVELKNLMFGGQKKGDYRMFVEALIKLFIKEVKVNSFPDFQALSNCLPLYAITGGNPSNTVDLIKEAVLLSLESGKEDITKEHFIQACNNLIFPYSIISDKNPFELSIEDLNIAIHNYNKGSNADD